MSFREKASWQHKGRCEAMPSIRPASPSLASQLTSLTGVVKPAPSSQCRIHPDEGPEPLLSCMLVLVSKGFDLHCLCSSKKTNILASLHAQPYSYAKRGSAGTRRSRRRTLNGRSAMNDALSAATAWEEGMVRMVQRRAPRYIKKI